MSFFDDASLVMIPSGYKDQKVYSVKPLDGSGDLTFSRASNATRVASNGLIEKVRTNQVLQSETFDNAYWSKINVSITANAIANPLNGATTADLLTVTDPSGPVEKTLITTASQAFTAGVPYTASAYFKAGSVTTTFRILAYDGTTLYTGGTIDLATIGNSTAPYVSLGNGWYRFWFTFTPSNSTSSGFVYFVNYAFGVAANAGTNVYVYGTQIEAGDIATDYIATTSAAVSVGPVSGLPRLDYLNSSCPRLLLEPQRTNSVLYSEQFDNGVWVKYGTGTVTKNSAISPDGTLDADLFVPNTTNYQHSIEQNMGTTSGTITMSVYAKASGYNWLVLNAYVGGIKNTFFDLQNGVIGTIASGVTASIQSAGNGWYRVICTIAGGANTYISLSPTTANNVLAFAGDGTSGVLLWGAQLEQNASYPTSYIPTLGTSVTRVADAASKTGISSLIGQTEGTLFVEEYYDATETNNSGLDDTLLSTSDGTSSNLISIFHYGNGTLPAARKAIFFIRLSGATQAAITSDALPTGTYKMALAYKNNDVVAYINGVQIGTDTSATIPATSVVTLVDPITTNAATKTVNIKQALVFKTRLTNAQLAELTTL